MGRTSGQPPKFNYLNVFYKFIFTIIHKLVFMLTRNSRSLRSVEKIFANTSNKNLINTTAIYETKRNNNLLP